MRRVTLAFLAFLLFPAAVPAAAYDDGSRAREYRREIARERAERRRAQARQREDRAREERLRRREEMRARTMQRREAARARVIERRQLHRERNRSRLQQRVWPRLRERWGRRLGYVI